MGLRKEASASKNYKECGSLSLFIILIGILAPLFAHNYRSTDGRLGDTVPAWQQEIINGTAPAPYVYRQAIPIIRNLLGNFLKPGHAALLLDIFLASLGLIIAAMFGRHLLPQHGSYIGQIVIAVAFCGGIPNDKPETVACITALITISYLLCMQRAILASIVAMAVTAVRPEIPVIVGMCILISHFPVFRSRRVVQPITVRLTALPVLSMLLGITYLMLSKFLWWPDAHYPPLTPFLTIGLNLFNPASIVFLPLYAIVVSWSVFHLARISKLQHMNGDTPFLPSLLGIPLISITWCVFCLMFGKIDEIRLLMPLLTPFIITNMALAPKA